MPEGQGRSPEERPLGQENCKTHVLAGVGRRAVASWGTPTRTAGPAAQDKVTSPSWHGAPDGPSTPASLPARVGRRLGQAAHGGTCQTITLLIEYLINYSGAKSIIHISFKRGGKSHCPLTEASQRLPRPWGLSHLQEELSQQQCGIAPAAAAIAARLPHAPPPGRTHTITHTHAAPTRHQPGSVVGTAWGDGHI